MPSIAASSGSSVSSSRRSPRSLPYDVLFSLTRNTSRTPSPASQRASASTSEGRRLTKEPRKLGIAQNEHRRSQPLASFNGAIGPPASRRRTARGPLAGARSPMPSVEPVETTPCPGTETARGVAVDRGDRQQPAPVLRRVRVEALTGQDRAQPGRDVGVVVEAEDGVGLGQRLGEVLAVALGQAADRDHGPGAPRPLEVGGRQQGVDRVLLGGLDEATGVHHDRLGVLGVVDQPEAVGGEPPGELLGVDVVARAAERHQGDGDVAVLIGGRVRPSVVVIRAEYAVRRAPGLPQHRRLDRTTSDVGRSATRRAPCARGPARPPSPAPTAVGRLDVHRRRRPAAVCFCP